MAGTKLTRVARLSPKPALLTAQPLILQHDSLRSNSHTLNYCEGRRNANSSVPNPTHTRSLLLWWNTPIDTPPTHTPRSRFSSSIIQTKQKKKQNDKTYPAQPHRGNVSSVPSNK